MKFAVVNCTNNKYKETECSFFHFPTDVAIRKQWLRFTGQGKALKIKNPYICMHHFKNEDFENNTKFEMGFSNKRFLKRGAIPSIKNVSAGNAELFEQRASRIQKRENKKTVALLLKEHNTMPAETANDDQPEEGEEILYENSSEYVNEEQIENVEPNSELKENRHENLIIELQALQTENQALKKSQKQLSGALAKVKEEMEKMVKINEFNIDIMEKKLLKANYELTNLEEKLLTIFTKGQISKLKSGVKRATWKEEDIAHSITLHAASSKLYKLLYRKNFPLPAVRTLQKWAQKVEIDRGLLKPVFKILKASSQMNEIQKVCVLSFDEMKTRKTYCYDRSSDSTLAPVSYVQVAMLRGLMSKWKQPVYYDFDCPMRKNILFSILEEAKSCGYTVVAITSDLGGANRAFLKELKVTEEQPWFMFNNKKIFSFADVPHLIKLLRNHFLDEGFIINGKTVKKEIVLKLLEVTSQDLNITHKISDVNLTVAGAKRQNVKLATKLFSHTVAQAISRAADHGYLENFHWKECHRLFKLTNDWFDVMNVKVPRADSRPRCHAYGLALNEQNKILEEMCELMQSMRAVGKKSLLPFQKGIIQSNNALKGLFNELKSRYNCSYILTYRLNQDVLEKFFGIIRSKGGLHDHPDQQEFKFRLRSYILGRNDGVISGAANVETDDTPDLERNEKSLTGLIFCTINVKNETDEETDEDTLEDTKLEGMAYDGLENLAGYICHKLKEQVPDIADLKNDTNPQCYTWVDHLSEGGLTKPTPKMMADMQALHDIFQSNNSDSLLITKNFIKKHIDQATEVHCSEKVKKLFFQARMFFKIRSLNREISEQIKHRKRKWTKTLT